MSSAEIKGFVVEGLMLAAIASMMWLPRMRAITRSAVAIGRISAEEGRATLGRISAVPLVIALAIVFALLTVDLVLPPLVRVFGYIVAAGAVAVSLTMRRLAQRIG
jgi:hypothetical protein